MRFCLDKVKSLTGYEALAKQHIKMAEKKKKSMKSTQAAFAGFAADFQAKSLDEWLVPESQNHNVLISKRPLKGRFNAYAKIIDDALENRFEDLRMNVQFPAAPRGRIVPEEDMRAVLQTPLDDMCKKAQLPEDLTQQIRADAIHLSRTICSLVPQATKFTIRLQIFGENCCSRFHQDQYVGRGIVSYTGDIATQYVADREVDFWELEHCGWTQNFYFFDKQLKFGALMIKKCFR